MVKLSESFRCHQFVLLDVEKNKKVATIFLWINRPIRIEILCLVK